MTSPLRGLQYLQIKKHGDNANMSTLALARVKYFIKQVFGSNTVVLLFTPIGVNPKVKNSSLNPIMAQLTFVIICCSYTFRSDSY